MNLMKKTKVELIKMIDELKLNGSNSEIESITKLKDQLVDARAELSLKRNEISDLKKQIADYEDVISFGRWVAIALIISIGVIVGMVIM